MFDSINPNRRNLWILDDNIFLTNEKILSELFTNISHHKNITVILLLQNLYPKGTYSRDISINTTYIVLMKNPRETSQVKRLSHQRDGTDFIFDSYIYETEDNPYKYLLVDYDQETPNKIRVRTNIFPGEEMITYVKEEKSGFKLSRRA